MGKIANIFSLNCFSAFKVNKKGKSQSKTTFSNFVKKIRICLRDYFTLDYVTLSIQPRARSIRVKQVLFNSEKKPLSDTFILVNQILSSRFTMSLDNND